MILGWATAQDEAGKQLIPFFPKKEFAEFCTKNEWSGYKAKQIDLDYFINKWITGMKNDGMKPSIFPTEDIIAVVNIDVFLYDLET
jgi:hypothetical protein